MSRTSSTLGVSNASAAAKPHYDGDPKERDPVGSSTSFKIKPRGLSIVWGKDKRYWSIPEKDDEPVELKQVCWLEVTAAIPLSKLTAGKYNVTFDVRLKPDAFGWNKLPIQIMAKIGKKGKYKWQTHILDIVEHRNRKFRLSLDEIVVTDAHLKIQNDNLYFGLYEVWKGRWKGGLVLEEAKLTKLAA